MRTRLLFLAFFTFHFSLLTLHAQAPQVTLSEDLKGAAVEMNLPFVSVTVPDGNYRVTMTLGAKKKAGSTTVRAESRRLMVENVATRRGERKTVSFVVNKRDTKIRSAQGEDVVRIKPRERTKLNWDDRLTLELTGDAPCVSDIRIEPADTTVTTLYLCGNSTVVDQDYEPWASWGQMIPRWLDDRVAVANYAESGETVSTFIGAKRFQKILTEGRLRVHRVRSQRPEAEVCRRRRLLQLCDGPQADGRRGAPARSHTCVHHPHAAPFVRR